MNTKRRQVGWTLWLQWLLVNILGWAVLWAVIWGGLPVGGQAGVEVENAFVSPVTGLIGGAIIGALAGTWLGMTQGFVLRQWVSPLNRWMLAYVVSWAVGGAIALTIFLTGDNLGLVADDTLCLTGLVTGWISVVIAQWLMLRRQTCQPGRWVFMNAVNWAAGGLVALVITIGSLILTGWSLGETGAEAVEYITTFAAIGTVGGAVGGAVSGVITGLLLNELCQNTL